ncbi:hypothetical protein WOC18_24120 [Vibrio parahaemolyticus]
MSTKKYEVSFEQISDISPVKVFITPDETRDGYFNVGIIYVDKTKGSFSSPQGQGLSFELKQNIINGEDDAYHWAMEWLSNKAGSLATLTQVDN